MTHPRRGSGFDHMAAYDAYQVSPAHVEMKANMGSFIERFVVFDGVGDLLGSIGVPV